MTKMNDARYEWFDIAKGIAILGIVVWHIQVVWIDHPLLHAHELAAGLWPVPVFFILAGFFLTDAKLQQPKDFIIKKGRRLLVPTICLYIIATLLHNVFVYIGFYSLNMDYDGSYITLYSLGETIKSIVFSIFFAGQELILAPMWFAYVLFVALCVMSIACSLLKRYTNTEQQYQNWQLFAFLLPYVIYTLVMLIHPIEIPRYHQLFAAIWLIYAGMLMRTRLHLAFNSGTSAVVSALTLYGCSILPAAGYVAYTVSSLSACYLLCYVAKAVSSRETILSRLLAVMGRESFYIMALHLLGFKLCTLLLNAFGADASLSALTPTVGSNVLLFIAYLAAGSLLPIAFILIYRKAKDSLLNRYSLLFVFVVSLPAQADSYDPNNYKPEVDTTKIDKTNLPIVFIDTRCGGEETTAIHKDWRIAARMKIISNADGINYGDTLAHPNQTVDYEGWIAIRYRGNTSFNFSPKKPYNFKTMKTADPDGDKLKTELLGMPKDNTWVLLAPYGDRSLLRDVLVWQLARPYFDYTPRCCYCELVLDGIYYGVFVLAENIRKGKYRLNLDDPGQSGDELTGGYQLQIDRDDEPHFTSKYKAVDSNGKPYSTYYTIYFQYKHPDYEDMASEQIAYIQQRVNQMEDALAADDFTNPDAGYRQYLDPMSFIDQQLSQEISGNVDGYRLSTNIYKHRDSQDARFKTALWDFNLAFGNSNSANAKETDFWRYQNSYLTSYNAYNKVPFWWMRLMEDPAYVMQLKERYAQYRNENYSNEHIEAAIDSITSLLREGGALERNNTTWKMFKSTTYDMEIDRIKQWLRGRVAWMDEQLEYDSSGIILPSADFKKRIVGYYTLKGERVEVPPVNSIIIVHYSDGTFRKIRTSQ